MCSCCDFGLVFCFCCGLCAVLAVTMVWYFVFGQKISKFLEKKCAEIKNVNKKPFSYIIYFFAVTSNSILVLASWSKIQYSSSQILGYFMLFCQVWIARRSSQGQNSSPWLLILLETHLHKSVLTHAPLFSPRKFCVRPNGTVRYAMQFMQFYDIGSSSIKLSTDNRNFQCKVFQCLNLTLSLFWRPPPPPPTLPYPSSFFV